MPAKSPEAIARKRDRDKVAHAIRQQRYYEKNHVYREREALKQQLQRHSTCKLLNMVLQVCDGEADNDAHYDQFTTFDGEQHYDLGSPGADLTFSQVVEWLMRHSRELKRKHPGKKTNIYCMFSMHYDWDKLLINEQLLTKDEKLLIASQRSRRYGATRTPGWEREIRFDSLHMAIYIGRKEIIIRILKWNRITGEYLYNDKGEIEVKTVLHIWDTWSLTAMSFLKTIAPLLKIMTDEERAYYQPLYDLIERGKAERGQWSDEFDYAKRREYNHAELETMYYWLHHIIEACARIGINPRSLSSPAAFARAALYKYGLQFHVQPKNYTSLEFQESREMQAQLAAYYGGRIECRVHGIVPNFTEIDITSAYPDKMRKLPCMAHGTWYDIPKSRLTTRQLNPFAIYHVKYSMPTTSQWGALPVRRASDSSIYYPLQRIDGWYYGVELEVAAKYGTLTILEGIEWVSTCEHDCPFAAMINELFDERARMIADGDMAGALVVKLMLNSMYGILAQNAGGARLVDNDGALIGYKLPKFYNLFGAGWITAATRAQLYDVVMQAPDAVLGIATDAIHMLGTSIPDAIKQHIMITDEAHKSLGNWTFSESGKTIFLGAGIRFSEDDKHNKVRGYATPVTYREVHQALTTGDLMVLTNRLQYHDIRMTKAGEHAGLFLESTRGIDMSPLNIVSKRDVYATVEQKRRKNDKRKIGELALELYDTPVQSYTLYPPYRSAVRSITYRRVFDATSLQDYRDSRTSQLEYYE